MTTVEDGDAEVLARLRRVCAHWPDVEEIELQAAPAALLGAFSPRRP